MLRALLDCVWLRRRRRLLLRLCRVGALQRVSGGGGAANKCARTSEPLRAAVDYLTLSKFYSAKLRANGAAAA